MKNHEELLLAVDNMDKIDCRQIMSNFDIYMNRTRRDLLLQTHSNHLNKAEKVTDKRVLNVFDGAKIKKASV